jgi:hypothetical protein
MSRKPSLFLASKHVRHLTVWGGQRWVSLCYRDRVGSELICASWRRDATPAYRKHLHTLLARPICLRCLSEADRLANLANDEHTRWVAAQRRERTLTSAEAV